MELPQWYTMAPPFKARWGSKNIRHSLVSTTVTSTMLQPGPTLGKEFCACHSFDNRISWQGHSLIDDTFASCARKMPSAVLHLGLGANDVRLRFSKLDSRLFRLNVEHAKISCQMHLYAPSRQVFCQLSRQSMRPSTRPSRGRLGLVEMDI